MTEIHKNNEQLRSLSKANKEIILWEQKNKMINSLAGKLWISSESAKKLSNLKTLTDISVLKKELTKINVDKTKFDENSELKQILEEIRNIQKLREEQKSKSRIEIASLKEWLEQISEYKINSSYTVSDKLFSSELLNKIENPEHLWHNLAWAAIWSIDTVYKAWIYTKDLAIWIIKTPVDLYKLATWKATTDSFKNV
jgi:hypothetical protein